MKIDYDSVKNQANIGKHGLDFEDVAYLDWDTGVFDIDDRKIYGETRFVAYLVREGRLYVVCFTMRDSCLRIISFRKANKREEKYYEEKTSTN